MSAFSKAYDPVGIEPDIYRRWEKSGYFNPDKLPNAKRRKPFVISMPPSNITGDLHVGHMLGFTVQDILIRYQRMRGRAPKVETAETPCATVGYPTWCPISSGSASQSHNIR